MGIISLLGKAFSLAQNLDRIDSAEEIFKAIPEKLDKLKEMADTTRSYIWQKNKDLERYDNEKKLREQGALNDLRIHIQPEKLLEIEYSISPKYGYIYPLEPSSDRLFVARTGECIDGCYKFGVVDIDGNIVIPFDYSYDPILCKDPVLQEDLILAGKDCKYGFINLNNEVIIDFQFLKAGRFSCGLAPVATDLSHYGYINKKGEYVVEPIYGGAENFAPNGLAIVSRGFCEDYGVIDTEGNIIVSPLYNSIEIHKDYISAMNFTYDTISIPKYFYFDLNGNPISKDDIVESPAFCEECHLFNDKPCKEIEIYQNAELKYGWYREVNGESICKIKPIYDSFYSTKYNPDEGGYSVIGYGGACGIIKIGPDKKQE